MVTPAGMSEYAWQWSIDNNYLVVLMQNGRIGLTLWLAIGVSVLIYGWKAVWSAPDTPYRRVARAVMYAVATVGLTQLSVAMFSTAAMLNWLFMGLGIGLAQGLARQPAKKKQTRPRRRPQQPPRNRDLLGRGAPAQAPLALRTASDR